MSAHHAPAGWVRFQSEGGFLLVPEATVLKVAPDFYVPRPVVVVQEHPRPPGVGLDANGAWASAS